MKKKPKKEISSLIKLNHSTRIICLVCKAESGMHGERFTSFIHPHMKSCDPDKKMGNKQFEWRDEKGA